MADIRIVPGDGVIQFTGSSAQVAFISASDQSYTISSSADVNVNADGSFIVSGSFILSSSTTTPFVIAVEGQGTNNEKFKINNEGIVVLGETTISPTAVPGGIYYSASYFYLGDGN